MLSLATFILLLLVSGEYFGGHINAAAHIVISDQPPLRHIRHGDIDLGGIISGLNYAPNGLCGDEFFMEASYHFSESVVYAIDRINQNASILPNITLGFVILDDCMKETTAAVQAMAFLPRMTESIHSGVIVDQMKNSTQPATSACNEHGSIDINNIGYGGMNTSQTEESPDADKLDAYDVVGVIGCLRSSNSIVAAHILSAGQVPIMSFISTSEKLSNRQLFPYFFRVIPSDSYLVDAQIELILQLKWKYISVVYAEGDFGETAYQSLRNRLSVIDDVCIATSEKIYQKDAYPEHLKIVKHLVNHKEARVVVAFTDPPSVPMFLKASAQLGYDNWFIWLSNESWKIYITEDNEETRDLSIEGFVAGFPAFVSPTYNQYAAEMNPKTNLNPWFHRQWEETFHCSPSDPDCWANHNATSIQGYNHYVYSHGAYEAVITYANAIENLIGQNCPGLTGKDVRRCITGSGLKQMIEESSFYSPAGLVEFDGKGSILSRIYFEQILPKPNSTGYDLVTVAEYDTRTSSIKFIKNISFAHHDTGALRADGVPESVCSQPCGPSQYKIQKEPLCCWVCRSCRNNEILVRQATACQECPQFTWPDATTNFTTCSSIEPNYSGWGDPLVVLTLCLALIGLVSVVMVTFAYIKHGDARVIKASSKELSYLQLFAILTGYLTTPVLNVKPDDTVCVTAFFMYCLSFTWLYAPLLVKAIRIHRIFQAGKNSTMRLKFISPSSQILFASLLILVQIVLCIVVTIRDKPSAALSQTVKTEKYVELSCNWTLPGLASFLAYNLVLIALCSVFAFKTRKLPDNFNESRFISLCVYTTLIIWLAFVPTFFTTSRQYIRRTLLSLSLLVNHSVAVAFLYLPKIYAAVHLIAPDNSHSMQNTGELTGNRFLSRRTMLTSDTAVISSTIPEGHEPKQQGHDSRSQGQGSTVNSGGAPAHHGPGAIIQSTHTAQTEA